MVPCKIFEDYRVVRCYKCNQYEHVQKYYKNKLVSPISSEARHKRECNSECKVCANCVALNLKFNLRLGTDHFLFCKILKNHLLPLMGIRSYVVSSPTWPIGRLGFLLLSL